MILYGILLFQFFILVRSVASFTWMMLNHPEKLIDTIKENSPPTALQIRRTFRKFLFQKRKTSTRLTAMHAINLVRLAGRNCTLYISPRVSGNWFFHSDIPETTNFNLAPKSMWPLPSPDRKGCAAAERGQGCTVGEGGYIDLLRERQVYYLDVYKRTCMNKIRIVRLAGIDSNSRGEIKRSARGKRGMYNIPRSRDWILLLRVFPPFVPTPGTNSLKKSVV